MAGFVNPADTVLSKSAQEMSINGDEPPPRFIVKENKFGSLDTSAPLLGQVPIIDINLLLLSSSSEVDDELEKMKSALSSWGSFQAINHGISSSFLDKVREVAKTFFALPAEEKRIYSRELNSREGYGNDIIVSDKQVLDWCDRLILGVLPEDQRNLHLWPENPNDFREVLHEYTLKVKSLTEILLKAMAKSLNLEENSFSSQFGDQSMMQGRFNYYPRCSRPDLVFGVKPHSDRSGITVLLQDKEVEGLQLLKDDQWFRVPIIPDALLINLGDQMQIMTNGIFKSPMHRVAVSSNGSRISVAMFNEPEVENEIGPVDDLVDEERPKLYRNVKNYGAINFECFQKGIVALDTVKV